MNPRFSYREAAVRGAGRVRLVILLYEQAIEDLRGALEACARNDIETRTREINHAILVLGHLQGSLDKEQGGQVAINLERFYTQVRAGLLAAQCRQSAGILELQISRLMQVRDAWCKAEQTEATATVASETGEQQAACEARSFTEWNA